MTPPESGLVRVTEIGSVTRIVLDRPEKHNALNVEMVRELHAAVTGLDPDSSKSVLITAEGETTCAGFDLDLVTSEDFSVAESDVRERQHEIFDTIRTIPRPVVLGCKGAAIGAGFVLALECDLVVAGEETRLSYPEIELGLLSNRTPRLLAHLFGAQIAREVVLHDQPVPPTRAYNWGLVSEIAPEAAVDRRAENLAERVAEYDFGAVALLTESLAFPYSDEDHRGYP